MNNGEFKKRYEKLATDRNPYEERARRIAEVTIPSLFPRQGSTSSTQFVTPYQSLAARGINNLSSKLLLVSLPTSHPFFRYVVEERLIRQMDLDDDGKADLESALAKMERIAQTSFETDGVRVPLFQTFRQLLVAGNVLFYKNPKTGRAKNYKLDKYVVKRDPAGEILELIVREEVDRRTLTPEIVQLAGVAANRQKPVEIYTKIDMQQGADSYVGVQEINGIVVDKTQTEWPKELLPYLALRFTAVDGEDYGRSFCEEYIGDVLSLEGLSQALVEGAAAAARVVFLVRPNSATSVDDIAEAENGDAVSGNPDDVSALRVERANDMATADATATRLEQRLQMAFLLNSAVRRDAERVTAEEIRQAVEELDDALGGYYTLMSHELQRPLATLQTAQLTRRGDLPPLPQKSVKPTIITGIEALGRGHELQKVRAFITDLVTLGPEIVQQWLNMGKLIQRLGTGHGIDLNGIVYDQSAVEQKSTNAIRQQILMTILEKLGPKGADILRDQLNPKNQQT